MKPQPIGKAVTIEEIQRISLEKNGKELTAKQAKTVQVYAITGNKSEAGRQAYASNKSEEGKRGLGVATLAKPHVKNVLVEIMDTIGLTDGYLMEELKSGIENSLTEGKKLGFITLALKTKGHLKQVNVNLSHTIKETRKGYDL